MDLQSLLYALIQMVHNLGAVAVVGGSLLGHWPVAMRYEQRRCFAWIVLAGWVVQAMSGASFGAVSFAYYGEFPDIHGIAIAALLLKMVCAVTGFFLAALYLRYGMLWMERSQILVWRLLMVLGVCAISAAAVLRWFS